MPASETITGLVLAGGQGSRMGGQDKGLLLLRGEPLALHALRRLRPQVGILAISANRHLETYAAMGVPVWADPPSSLAGERYAGPLAGFMGGLARCETDLLATVPCDTPCFPSDLVARLAQALATSGALMASAATRRAGEDGVDTIDRQPVFCLMHNSLAPRLAAFIASGRRRVGDWAASVGGVQVVFDTPDDFLNANTPDDLARLQAR